jgi:TRAP transporter TAXI family solute receptor
MALGKLLAHSAGAWELAVVLSFGLTLTACRNPSAVAPQHRELTIAVGSDGGVSSDIGRALAASYEQNIAGLRITQRPARGVDGNLEALKSGDADLGFVDAEGAYVNYRLEKSGGATRNIRAIAVLYPTAVHLFVRRTLDIRSVPQLRNHAVVVGERGDYSDRALLLILDSYGLDYSSVRPIFATGPAALAALKDGRAAAIISYTPFRRRATLELMQAADLELVPLDRRNIGRMQATSERNHFLKTTTIAAGTYPGQTRDVLTMGDEILLLCRADLDDALVYALTKTLFDSVPALTRAHPAAASINVERGPTTSVPLHPGAARYYRDRELPR